MITAVTWFLFFKAEKEFSKNSATKYYRYFFLVIGMATLLGGIFGHALCYKLGLGWKLPGWIISMIAIMLAERGSIMHAMPSMSKNIGRFFAMFNILELCILIVLAVLTLNFFWVEFHALYGLGIVVGSFELFHYIKTKSVASLWILFSVGVSFIAAFVQIVNFDIYYPWFRSIDFAHIIMCITSFTMFNGIRKII